MVDALVFAATSRVVRTMAASTASRRVSMGRPSMSGARVSMDDTLDMIKLVIVGDSGVGKTCLMLRFIKDEFVTSTRATIGMECAPPLHAPGARAQSPHPRMARPRLCHVHARQHGRKRSDSHVAVRLRLAHGAPPPRRSFCTRQLSVDLLHASETSVVQRLTVQVWDTAGQEQFHSLTATYYRKAGGVMIVYDANIRSSFESLTKWVDQVEQHAEDVVKMVVAAKSEGDIAVTEEEGRAFAHKHGCLFATTSSMLGEGVLPAFKLLSSHVLAQQERKEEEREGLLLSVPTSSARPAKKGCC